MSVKTVFTTIMLAALCFATNSRAEQMVLEVIPLQHRMTDDVVHILQPLVVPGGTITGMNNQLIIKTTPGNLEEIKHVLQSLDRSPRRLLITVKQDIGGQIYRREDSISGRYSAGDVSVSSRDPGASGDGLVIAAEDDDGNRIQYRNQNSRTNIDDRNAFRVQVLEGHHAFIQAGQTVPIRNQATVITRNGVVVSDGVEYHDATSGFYVLPRLNGDIVTLLVAPKLTQVQPGRPPVFDVQNVETTASGRLGEWVRIGGIDQSFDDRNRQNLSSSRTRGQQTRSVLIKVDEIK